MKTDYGFQRVLEPKHVLPTSAWRLDNSRYLMPGEIRIDIKRIHIEGTSFREICLEGGYVDERIKQKIMDIVIRRGKLHNPVTDTGGLLYGVVSEIDPDYPNKKGFKVGEEVICNASLASIPLGIDEILSVDRAFGQIEVEGYAIISGEMPIIRKPEDLPIKLLMYTLDESGTIYRISSNAVGKKRVLVVGSNLLSNLLFGAAIRKVARDDARIVCLLDHKTDAVLKGPGIDRLTKEVFSEVHYVDILRPLECIETISGEELFDLSVNCVDIIGAETINILATKNGGTVVFANLITNYNIALYITEAISRQLDIRCADGYLEAYDEFDFELVREMVPYIEDAVEANVTATDRTHSVNKKSQMSKTAGSMLSFMEDFICESPAMQAVMDEILTVSKYDCNVLITGESGAGKERVADIIHRNSNRKMQPFIKVNCGAMDSGLLEGELFGRESETPRSQPKKGFFEQAENGALLLEDIGALSPDMQIKLLRAIQDGEFFRVGGSTPIKTNVRIISSSNKELEDVVTEGSFRRDLYYQLNVVKIRVPSLRERVADIPGLVDYYLEDYGTRFDINRTISDDAVDYLCQCDWPGNARELENFVQRLMINAKSEEINLIDVMREMHSDVFEGGSPIIVDDKSGEVEGIDMETMVENFEKNIIKHALEKYGSTRKAAKAIGVSQTQLVRKKNKYGL